MGELHQISSLEPCLGEQFEFTVANKVEKESIMGRAIS